MKDKKSNKVLILILLQFIVVIYTMSGVAAKFASQYEFLSFGFILCYGIEICILGVYAVLWQQIIKRVDLSVAYANRAVALLWSMVWAVMFFSEQVTIKNIIGVVVVLLGTMIVNMEEKK